MPRDTEAGFKIEKGVPSPTTQPGAPKYPWDEMTVGDSFLVPPRTDVSREKHHNSLYNVARAAGIKRGWKFQVRRVGDGLRVWRTA